MKADFSDPSFVIIPGYLAAKGLSYATLIIAGRINRLSSLGKIPDGVIPVKKIRDELQVSKTAMHEAMVLLSKNKIIERRAVGARYSYTWKGANK